MQRPGGRRFAALFGEETELDQDHRQVDRRALVPRLVQQLVQMQLGEREVAGFAASIRKTGPGHDLAKQRILFGGQPQRPPAELDGLREIPGLHGNPAQPAEPGRHVRPQAKVLRDRQRLLVQPGGPPVVADQLGQRGQPLVGLQLTPPVPEVREQPTGPSRVPLDRVEISSYVREFGSREQRGGGPPPVAVGFQAGHRSASDAPPGDPAVWLDTRNQRSRGWPFSCPSASSTSPSWPCRRENPVYQANATGSSATDSAVRKNRLASVRRPRRNQYHVSAVASRTAISPCWSATAPSSAPRKLAASSSSRSSHSR